TVLDELSADEWFGELQPGQFRMIAERTTVFGESMRVVATRSPAGDLVIIATDFHVWETWQLYKLRWTIESTFGSQKSRGFDLERTGVTDPRRLERLFGLVTLAWLACLRVGVWRHEAKPIRAGPWPQGHERGALRLGRTAPCAAVGSEENQRDPTRLDMPFSRTGTAGN
ncbi:transposase, partial [Deinococcus radiopugnans]|uniref:transposase n=1 Tax=Deinococcus radiopugnans TaxID=57497 RepID=UPI00360CBF42